MGRRHDLGLWSDLAVAYLEPSVARTLADNKARLVSDEHADIVTARRGWIDFLADPSTATT